MLSDSLFEGNCAPGATAKAQSRGDTSLNYREKGKNTN